MYMLILNFTYPLRCLRIPPVEYHCITLNPFHCVTCTWRWNLTELHGVTPLILPQTVLLLHTAANFEIRNVFRSQFASLSSILVCLGAFKRINRIYMTFGSLTTNNLDSVLLFPLLLFVFPSVCSYEKLHSHWIYFHTFFFNIGEI